MEKKLTLDDVDAHCFKKLFLFTFGKSLETENLDDLIHLAKLADRFEMTDALSVLESEIVGQLSSDTCVEAMSSACGLLDVSHASREMVLQQFEKVDRKSTRLNSSH